MPQPEMGVTYAAKIDKGESRVDWTLPAAQVARDIRALSPFPGAWCDTPAGRLKLLHAVATDGTGQPGEVLRDLTIACGTGAVQVTEVQREGKRPMPVAEALRGLSLPAGTILAPKGSDQNDQ
jgi:methionyl-tRNA formyltransferase